MDELLRVTTMVELAESKTRVYCSFGCFLSINVAIIMWMFVFFLCVELCVLVWLYNLCVSEAHRQYGISLVQVKCGNENNLQESILSFYTVFWDQTQVIRLSLIPCVLFFLNGVRKLIFRKADKEGRELNSYHLLHFGCWILFLQWM